LKLADSRRKKKEKNAKLAFLERKALAIAR